MSLPDLSKACWAVAVIAALGWLIYALRSVRTKQEETMAQFEGLDADINELRAEVGAAATRVEAAVERLMSDDADQTEIEEARTDVRDAINQLKSIAPPQTEEPAPVPTPEPDQPF